MLIPKDTLGLAAEFAVASELCRRGLYAQLTLGNKKRTDLLVHDDETNTFLRIEVKAKQGQDWPNCKGIYGENVMLVFVDYMNKKDHERPDFFVLTVEDWRGVVNEHAKRFTRVYVTERNVAVFPDQLTKSGKPYEGTGVRVAMIEKYREAWGKIIKAKNPQTALNIHPQLP
jgi:hypothetical protein